MELHEELSGVGLVEYDDGTVIGHRHYTIAVWQQELGQDTRTTHGRMRAIEEDLELDPSEFFVLEGRSLVLTLEDGRRLPFFLAGPNGAIAARGELERKGK